MTPITQCLTEDDLRRMLLESRNHPVLLLKHSTSCPISAAAKREFDRFAAAPEGVACWVVLVIEQRPLSQQIARTTGVPHQSPQAILLVDEQPVWHASHWSITEAALRQATQRG